MADTHAIVVGAGVAGLCAARVLAESFDRVTVLDRDVLPQSGDPRPGVPQGRHVHAVLVRATLAIRELFPGLIEEAAAEGMPMGDVLADSCAYLGPHRLRPAPSGLEGICISRPQLEFRLRRRLAELSNVGIAAESVVGLTASAGGGAVTGVRLGPERELPGDLVVDASGRGSRATRWLTDLGHSAPPEQRFDVDVAYSSCTFAIPRGAVGNDLGILVVGTPRNPRGGGVVDMGGGEWLVSLAGYRGNHPPVTLDGFLDFAARLPVPDIHRALRAATPVGTPVRFRYPQAVRRHFERLPRFPDGLVIVGDAVSSFNPVYGQGMSVAALEALLLRRHLRAHGAQGLAGLRHQIAEASAVAWSMSTNNDLRMPWIPGRRPPSVRLGNAYLALLHRAARHDAHVARAFMRVANLVDGPAGIARPSIALRVLIGSLPRPAPQPSGRRSSSHA